MNDHSLPGILGEIADVAGIEAAWALAMTHGGTRIYIKADPSPGYWLVELIGPEAAAAICKYLKVGDSGAYILIPIAKLDQQRRRLFRALQDGASAAEAARAAGMHERTAFRARKKIKEEDEAQLKLL